MITDCSVHLETSGFKEKKHSVFLPREIITSGVGIILICFFYTTVSCCNYKDANHQELVFRRETLIFP